VTARLPAIVAAAERIEAKSFTIKGEAMAREPDGLSRFAELRYQAAARTAVLYAFDVVRWPSQVRPYTRNRQHALYKVL